MTPACPPLEELQRLGGDSLADGPFQALEGHIADCPHCQERLERLVRVDATDSMRPPPRPVDARPPEVPGFVIGAELGRGGCGVVYEALQPRIGRRVALKFLTDGPSRDAHARERWLREARALGRVRAPNVVRLHEAGEHEGRLYLVLDLVPGGSLKSLLTGPVPPRDAARLIETMARAVAGLHALGVLHLDIKPSNILLDGPPGADWSELAPMLSDFGIALAEEGPGAEASASGTLGTRGTPAFMAPEQVTGRRRLIGPGADIFGLGATLYTMLTGRPPFQAATAIETLDLLRSSDPTPPRSMVPGLPRDLETICLVCLQKGPARRYGSAAALADDLRRWLDGYPIRARPVSTVEHAVRWCRRHPMPASLAITLAATIVASLAGLTALWRQSAFQRDRAEFARERALQGEATAQAAVGDLVKLLYETVEAPEQLVSDRVAHSLPVVLDLTAKLRRTPRLAADHAPAIAKLELRLSHYLYRGEDYDGVRRLLDDAMDLLELAPERIAADWKAASSFVDILMQRVVLDTGQARYDAAIEDCRRAEHALAPYTKGPEALDSLTALHSARVAIAASLAAAGQVEESRAMLRSNREMFRRMIQSAPDNAPLEVIGALATFEAEPSGSALSAASGAIGRLPEGARLPQALALVLADLLACELCESTQTEAGRQADPVATAARLLRAVDARASELRLGPDGLGTVLERVSQRASIQAMAERRAGRLDDARRTVAWMLALGDAALARRSDWGRPHVLKSRAYEQEAKIGWAQSDPVAVERFLRSALEEASRALDLGPDDEVARQHLAGIREKLVRLVANEPER